MQILLVEDDASTLAMLEKNFIKWGYTVLSATNGRQALEMTQNTRVDLIVSDWLMPEMNGRELSRKIRALDFKHYIYIILISAQDTRMDIVRGLESGVDDFIAKPINMEELRVRMEIGVRILKLEHELNQKFIAIKRNYYQTIHMFTQLLETYHEKLGGHCRRVGALAMQMAKSHTGIPSEEYPIIEAAGMLHDIGLIGLPETLLKKRRIEFSGDEFELYRSHSERGEAILNQIDLLKPVARIVRMHHEQYNGRGFPDGLAGTKIPLTARLVAAASIYDDLAYQEKIPLDQVAEHLQQYRGYQLDPDLVDLLLAINLQKIEEEARKVDLELRLDELNAGMVLSRDVRMKTGAFVMAGETCLDAVMIEKLKRYHELGNISDKVFVRK
jgi:response regulator RpfG family c-di-GMP phosphodiesterase